MSEQNVVEGAQEFAAEPFEGNFGGSSFEQDNETEDDGSGSPAPGMGQSKSSRRRRRKRKKLATGGVEPGGSGERAAGEDAGNAAAPVTVVMEGESLALAGQPDAPAPPRRPMQNGSFAAAASGGNGQFAGAGQGKRWKKKFRDRDRRGGREGLPPGEFRAEASGNGNGNGFGGGERSFSNDRGFDRPFRREGGRPDNFGNLISHQQRKQKGPGKERLFVGPMDHSYREVGADFADTPPSTIQTRGRRGHRNHGDGQPVDYNAPRAQPIADDAPTHIYLFVDDLFITAKVQEVARKQGVKVAFVKNDKDAVSSLLNAEDQARPSLIIFDLNNANAKPLTLIPKIKAKLKRSVSVIGFLSSIQGDLKAKAVEAGCDTVMPRAAFSQNLPNLLRRYGVDEVEEINYNY